MGKKVDLSRYGSSSNKLTQDDLEENVAVVTLVKVEDVEFDSDGEKKICPTFLFQETGDLRLWGNITMMKDLIARLGDDPSDWPGQKVVIEKHVAEFGGKRYPKVRIAPAEEWDQYLGSPRRRVRGKARR
jgi:hypothetical protein